jgi:hypothetical protein
MIQAARQVNDRLSLLVEASTEMNECCEILSDLEVEHRNNEEDGMDVQPL